MKASKKSLWVRLAVLMLLAFPGLLLAQVTTPVVIGNTTLQGGQFTLSFSTEECRTYVVNFTTSLTPPVMWYSLAQVAGNGSVISLVDSGAGAQPSRYYCVSSGSGGGYVYSLNIVGFERRILQSGTNLVANPLYSSSGDNSIGSLFPNAPEGSQILVARNDSSLSLASEVHLGVWDPPNVNLLPGQGVILVNPSAPFEVAFVGDVPQGTLNNPIPAGWSLRSSMAPVRGLLNFPAQNDDLILTWNTSSRTYVEHYYFGGGWYDWDGWPVNPPSISPGEAFWAFVSQPINWVQQYMAPLGGSGGWGPPVIANQPQSRTNLVGTIAKFAVAVTGAPLSYQWYFNTNAPLADQTSCTLILSNVQPSNAGTYSVVITNTSGSVTSAPAALTVVPSAQAPVGVIAWGDNSSGQTNVPPGLSNVVAVAGGAFHSLGLLSNGTVTAWGNNSSGQTNVPVGLSNVVAVAGGDEHSLALRADGTVAVWGDNTYGQTNVPVDLANVVAVAGGYGYSLALRSDGRVVAWGSGRSSNYVPAELSNVVAIAAGGLHSLALRTNGTVIAWGYNSQGQTNVPPGLSNVVAVAAANFHSLALQADGQVVAWGDNGLHQTNVPAGLTNVVAVAGGAFHSLALRSNGTVAAWGANWYGQTDVPTWLSNVVAVAAGPITGRTPAGGHHSLALTGPAQPMIFHQPVSRTNDVGTTARFSAAACGIAPLAYHWRLNGTNLNNVGSISGATTATLTISNVRGSDAGAYSVVITNASGSATSTTATLTVSPDSDGDGMPDYWELANGLNPNNPADSLMDLDSDGMSNLHEYLVGTNPRNSSSTFFLSITDAMNGNITLTWPTPVGVLQLASSLESGVWQNVAGPTSPYTVPANSPQRFYRLVYSRADLTVYSVNIVGYVNLLVPPERSVISNPLSYGNNAISLVIPNPPDGSLVIKQGVENWYFAGFGWDDPSMRLAPGEPFELWNLSSNPFTTTFVGEVTPAPVVMTPPRSANLIAGAQTNLFVSAFGWPALRFQWRFDGMDIPSATTSVLTVPDLQLPDDSGNYDVVVTNSHGSTTSLVAVVQVGIPPAIVAQPQSQTVSQGANVTFTVGASGTGPLSYQWFFNQTTVIPQATNAILNLGGVTAINAGSYRALVSSDWGSVYSTAAVLIVVAPVPCISVSVDPAAGHPMGSPITLHVRSFDCATSNAAPNVTAVVYIITAGTTRSLSITTDGSGQATVYFQPLAGEAGQYQISAGLPNQTMPPPQDTFPIVGIGFTPPQLSQRLVVGVPVTNHIELRNLTDRPLSGLEATPLDAPANVMIQIEIPPELPGNETGTLTCVFEATGPTPPQIPCRLRVTSAEGASNELSLTFEVAPAVPQLVVSPPSLSAAMLRGGQSLATFFVTNTGGAASGDLQVRLPAAAWLGLATPPVISSLAPQECAAVTVSLTPSTNLQFGSYTGNNYLWSPIAGQTTVPFQFNCVSALQGGLRVTVVDEFTYYASGAPKVANATVTLLDPFFKTNITSAVSDADGVALFTNLTEAYYGVQVAATQHGSFSTVLLLPAGRTFELTAFLARQMVSYRWIVTTQAITDRYIFTLDTRFQTDVPAPVVRVEPGALNLCDYEENAETSWRVNLKIFNSGLITAEAARLHFGTHPRFAIRPLTTNIGPIRGLTTNEVPVIISRLAGTNDGPSQIEAHLDWELPTANGTRYYQVPIYVYNAGLHDCDPGSTNIWPGSTNSWTGGGDGNGNGNDGGGEGFGGDGYHDGSSTNDPIIIIPPEIVIPTNDFVHVEVGLQLSQSAVITRNAFEASLELKNGSTDLITELGVTIEIRDCNNLLANQKFGIRPPDLIRLNAVDGTGVLGPLSDGVASWTIIPTADAAPAAPACYTVGGTLSYIQDGHAVTIKLFPVPITVLPDPRLVVDYFWERIVYSDDPFTPGVEEPVPMGVGLRMKNIGFGKAMDVTITSAQPQIVDNTNGLLIDFQLTGTQVGTQPVRPSLTAELGDIEPGNSAVAVWWMKVSLQGDFKDFRASFSHLDDLGLKNLSLVESVAIHPLVHVVRAGVPVDDLVPDFLVNDRFPTNTLPDSLYLSDGSVAPVTSVTSGAVNPSPGPGATSVTLTASLPSGWVYLRIPDPGPGMPLGSVKRSDGRFLQLGYNVWTTHRIVRPPVGPPYEENFLHLLDYDSTGSYTLSYDMVLTIIQQPQSRTNCAGTTAILTVVANGTAPLTYQWFKDGAPLPGETSDLLTIPGVQPDHAGLYWVEVSNIAGPLPSDFAELTVREPARFVAFQPQSRTNLVGTTATFKAVATGTPPLNYVWVRGDVAIHGQDSDTLTITNVQIGDEGTYWMSVQNACGGDQSYPEVVELTVWAAPSIFTQPQDQTNLVGTLATFSVVATGRPFPTYQWFKDGVSLPGETANALTITNVQAAHQGYYSVLVSNCVDSVPSRGAFLAVSNSSWICPVADQFATVGRLLVITNCTENPVLPVTFSLDPSAPAGAAMTPDGIFRWTPQCDQGGTTNLITIWAADSGVPAITNLMVFTVTVFDCVQLGLGNGAMLAGHTNSVQVRLSSAIALTNLAFTVAYPAERFTNFTLSVDAPQVLAQEVSYPKAGEVRLSFTLPPGSVVHGPANIADLRLTAPTNQSSAFVPLVIKDVVGLKLDGRAAANAAGSPGRMVVIGPEPLLEFYPRMGPLRVRLYGNPGRNHVLHWKTNLFDESWQTGPEVSLTDLWQDIEIPTNAPSRFYRALKQ